MTTTMTTTPALVLVLALAALTAACDERAPATPTGVAAAAPATGALPVVLGITLGQTSVADARAALAAAGLACEDASLMAMMAKAHVARGVRVPDEALAAARRGERPPEAAGMPSGHAKYLEDPALQQVRISCEGVPVAALGDGRAGVTGRVLVVADAEGAPVTFVAFQRTHRAAAAAVADARAMFAAHERTHGAPRRGAEALPAADELRRYQPVRRRWRAGSLRVTATLVDLGDTGISVSEEWTVRYLGPAEAPGDE
jgi:hypothetical protein